MSFYYYNPYSDIHQARRQLQRAFDDFWGDNSSSLISAPKLDSQQPLQQQQNGEKGKEKAPASSPPSSNQQQLAKSSNEAFSLSDFFNNANGLWRPIVDVKENENELIIHAELPGVTKEDISIDIADGVLSLSGEKKHTHKEENERYHRIERSYGRFSRTFKLPQGVDASNINASFKDGVLELSIPRPKVEEPVKHKIAIQ